MPELVEIVGLLMWLALNLPILILILMLRMPKLHILFFVVLYFLPSYSLPLTVGPFILAINILIFTSNISQRPRQ